MPPPERPVKLTFPAREPGARKIMADGLQVGHMLADHRMRWTAYLWLVRCDPHMGLVGEVRGRNLAEAREAARKRLDERGPWWVAEHPDGLESETAATRETG